MVRNTIKPELEIYFTLLPTKQRDFAKIWCRPEQALLSQHFYSSYESKPTVEQIFTLCFIRNHLCRPYNTSPLSPSFNLEQVRLGQILEHPVAQWSQARLITCLNPKAASSIPARGNWNFSLQKETARVLSQIDTWAGTLESCQLGLMLEQTRVDQPRHTLVVFSSSL